MRCLLEEYLKLFDILCVDYLKELPDNIRKKQRITDVNAFCKEIKPQFKKLITYFLNDKEKFER